MSDATIVQSPIEYDPYDYETFCDPYPVFARLREEAPLYYNEQYDFFAISRADDVERALADNKRLSNFDQRKIATVNIKLNRK